MKAVEEQTNFFGVLKQKNSNDKNEILMKSVHKSIAEYYLQELSSRIKEEIERKKVESEKEKITNEG